MSAPGGRSLAGGVGKLSGGIRTDAYKGRLPVRKGEGKGEDRSNDSCRLEGSNPDLTVLA